MTRIIRVDDLRIIIFIFVNAMSVFLIIFGSWYLIGSTSISPKTVSIRIVKHARPRSHYVL
ncbi:hypothetical protein DL93DRAFT_2085370 [Clavulina sp. PMI_390]|nr:hypothetical protein DL93DRAFT_2085370 [Clavulina sp. PMI_390]